MSVDPIIQAYREGLQAGKDGAVAGMLISAFSGGIVGFILGWIAHVVIR